MENLDILALKVSKAAEKIKKLSDENIRLRIELNHYKTENDSKSETLSQHLALKKNAQSACVKIERLLKKIDTLKGA
jgi:regulator of replication initiation timing